MTKLWQSLCPVAFGPWLIVGMSGCLTPPFNIGQKADPPKPADGFVLVSYESKGDKKDPAERKKLDDSAYDQLDAGKRLKHENDLVKAEKVFSKLADNAKNPLAVIEEARFLEAECQLLREDYRSAAATYTKQIQEVRDNKFTQLALEQLFFIANHWLNDTRKQMEADYKQRNGGKPMINPQTGQPMLDPNTGQPMLVEKVWFVPPMPIVHFDHKKPFLDEEGHAIQCLETIIANDHDKQLRAEALFWLATVQFFRGDYGAADVHYTALWRDHPNSPNAVKALKQSVLCKLQVNGGTVYNPKTIEEARKAMEDGQKLFPEFARDREWLDQHAKEIHLMQADRDFQIAEFYRRTSKWGAAHWYYKLVIRRNPGTNYQKKAEERIAEIRVQVEREQEAQSKAEAKLQERSPRSATDPQIQQASWFSRILPVSWQKKKDQPQPESE